MVDYVAQNKSRPTPGVIYDVHGHFRNRRDPLLNVARYSPENAKRRSAVKFASDWNIRQRAASPASVFMLGSYLPMTTEDAERYVADVKASLQPVSVPRQIRETVAILWFMGGSVVLDRRQEDLVQLEIDVIEQTHKMRLVLDAPPAPAIEKVSLFDPVSPATEQTNKARRQRKATVKFWAEAGGTCSTNTEDVPLDMLALLD